MQIQKINKQKIKQIKLIKLIIIIIIIKINMNQTWIFKIIIKIIILFYKTAI
jgi:hypothetical protein